MPLGSCGVFEFDGLSILQAAKAVALDHGVVDEDVLTTWADNEAKSFSGIKPLDSSHRHAAPRCRIQQPLRAAAKRFAEGRSTSDRHTCLACAQNDGPGDHEPPRARVAGIDISRWPEITNKFPTRAFRGCLTWAKRRTFSKRKTRRETDFHGGHLSGIDSEKSSL
jgi:hypothetical protein